MKTLCVLMQYQTSGLAAVVAGRPVAQWIEVTLDQCLPSVPRVRLGPWDTVERLIADLKTAAEGYAELVLVAADAPLLRGDLVAEMLELHRQYRADYTFADGYPLGLCPEIVRPSILTQLAEWASGKTSAADREALFQLLSTDINRFDVETKLSPVDLRSRRLSLTTDSARNRLLLERYAADSQGDLRGFLDLLEATPQRSRTLPATLHLQITDGVVQTPLWSPILQFAPQAMTQRNTLDRQKWNDLLDRALAWAGDLTVLPAFWGEPSLHPHVLDLFGDALQKPGLKLCVETSGLGWSQVDLESWGLASHPNLQWIVALDSNVQATYQLLRGDGFDEAQAFVRRLLALAPHSVWPQTVRMKENEEQMESFYQHWKTEAGRVIIQKHNDFGGRLPTGKPSDLSPWKRHPCWHLARDLAVFLDGTTVVCQDDFQRSQSLGNVWTDSLEEIWERGSRLFDRHTRDDWPDVCRKCDEWYTFHF